MAQQQDNLDKALRHLEQKATEWELETADLMDVIVSDQYVSEHNGASHFYFIQRYAGTPIYSAVNGVHLSRAGEVVYATNAFQSKLAERVNTTQPLITAFTAVNAAFANWDIELTASPRLQDQKGQVFTFFGDDLANNNFEVKLRYFPVDQTGEIRLAWDMAVDLKKSADYWSIRIDALTGEVLHQHNYTIYCNFDHKANATTHADNCAHDWDIQQAAMQPLEAALLVDGDCGYNVFALPAESPIHGPRVLLTDPADPVASPFGWHDIDGMAGPEYNITRGNNTHAYLDEAAINSSMGDEPDGGEDLLFDFFFDLDEEPENMKEADVTQLFYMVNMMHDITFRYGFNEDGGNFQRNNYTGVDGSNDHVLAEAQDGSGTNNANFATPPDGANGRMQMFLWGGVAGRVLTVTSPATIAGGYDSGTASYGLPVPAVPVVGEVVRAFDASSAPNILCEAVANPDEVEGKIALVDRGSCFFEQKTLNAQAAGAIAVVICNYLEDAMGMAGGVDSQDPTITTVSLGASDCNLIKNLLDNGETVTLSIGLPENSGPTNVSSAMDNGIIAHEYGHGISNRLTGGPGADDCLFNDEQMGEGWSDFFALITTVRPGEDGATARGIGNYADRKPADGSGIRRLPYSNDLTVNDHDLDDIIGTTAPHPLGEVWVTTIWDLYWAMTDLYGFDEDVINGTGGNNMAIQLVMDGMALQRCNPGFTDARDALFTADFLNYDGIHECLIWEVFARRGIGFDADQNSRFDRNDNVKNFDTLPTCLKELKISKTADEDLIVAGETFEYTLEVVNHKDETATGVIVEDELPNGLSYVNGSATGASVTNNGSSLTFDIGDMESGDEITITYEVNSNPANRSIQQFYDGMEDGDDNWLLDIGAGIDIWDLSTDNPNTGNTSWFINNAAASNDQFLVFGEDIEVNGVAPTVRFYHFYETQPALDGGFVQISTDNGFSWNNVSDAFIRNGYRGELAAPTLFQVGIDAFWGNSDGYLDSYLDLSAYQGQTVQLRFRFASNDENGATGWFVDDFEIMDKVAYEGEACVSSNDGDLNCDRVKNGGVIVDTEFVQSTENAVHDPQVLQVYPNPARNMINVAISKSISSSMDIQLISSSGVVVRQWRDQALQGQMVPLNISDIPAGFYFLQVNTKAGIYSEKVTIQ